MAGQCVGSMWRGAATCTSLCSVHRDLPTCSRCEQALELGSASGNAIGHASRGGGDLAFGACMNTHNTMPT
jgi:hypothetical protein